MNNLLTRRSLLAGAAAGSGLLSVGCTTIRTGFNPLLATNDLVQRLFIGIHRDRFALNLLASLLLMASPLLTSNRAFGVLAFGLVANLLRTSGSAASPDPLRVYMKLDDNTLVMLNPENGVVLARTTLGQQPTLIAASPNGDFLAVSNAASHSVSIVTTSDNRVSKTIQLEAGSAPYGIAVGEDGNKVYVVNEARNSISVLDVAASRVLRTIATPGNPSKIAISPDGSTL